MPWAYVTIATLKGTGVLNIDGTAYDTRLRKLSEDISQQIDRTCNRTFQPRTITRTFDGDGSTSLIVPDLIAVTSIKEDTNEDGTFETTWAGTAYLLSPHNAQPTEDWGRPYTSILVNPNGGDETDFQKGVKVYEVVGTWGYTQVLLDTKVDTSGSLGGSGTTTVNVNTAGVEPGMTILVDSEQMYVESTGAAGTAITVQRPVNGSTAGTHASGVDIKTYVYPGPIQEASIIQTARVWKRRESGFANQVGFPDTGVMVTWRGGLDPDVKEMLYPYRRLH